MFESIGIESSSLIELSRHRTPRTTEAPKSSEPSVSPVSRFHTAVMDSAPNRADRSLIFSLRALSRSVLRMRSTPG